MSTEPQLEAYLNSLDKSLGPIPISDRAEIIMEIKSHILDSMEKTPDASLNSILDSIGEPESVANRYLLERGLKVNKPPKSPRVKWLTIGFLGTLSIFFLFLTVLLWKFTPIISIDDESGRVVILGGLIDINGKSGKIHTGTKSSRGVHSLSSTIDGSKEVTKFIRKVSVHFSNGSFQFTSEVGQKDLKWQCQGGSPGTPATSETNKEMTLDFRKLEGTNCKIQLPDGMSFYVQGNNGQVRITKPRSAVEIQLDNGQIMMAPDPGSAYKYQLQLNHGHADHFISSNSSKAIEIKVNLKNGYINQENL